MSRVQEIEDCLAKDWKFLEKVYGILLEGNAIETKHEDLIVKFVQPDELKKIIDFTISDDETTKPEDLMEICKKVVEYSVKTNHPRFHNQLFGQMDPYGLAGTWISESLNTSAYTFEVAPVFSLMETEIIQKMCNVVGYEKGDGIFAPGGSSSNMYAMALARFKMFPEVKTKGLNSLPPLVMFTSEESHYSFKKSMHWLGMGTDNHVSVKTVNGCILAADLEAKILAAKREGKLPFFVNAVAGSTVLGAFDNLSEVADICEKYNLWMHVDACLGGAALLSQENRMLVKGIERSNSIAWNPHKSLGAPLQCALFLTKEENLLAECNSTDAKYLFQQDKYYDVSYDTGNKSVQCGRKVDAFKLWLMFKARGLNTFGALVDHTIAMSKLFVEKLRKREGFRVVQESYQFTNVCFWYIPKAMRNQNETPEWWNELYKVAPRIKKIMVRKGNFMVGYSPLAYKNMGNFIRMVFSCFPVLKEDELEFLLNEIEILGEVEV